MNARLTRFLCWLCGGHEWVAGATALPLSGRTVEECHHCEATRVRPLPPPLPAPPRDTLFVDLRLPR